MAYDTSALMRGAAVDSIGSGVQTMRLYVYDTVDSAATVDTAGYITDAVSKKGMKKGDLVFVRGWTTAPPTTSAERQTAAGTANILTRFGMHVVIGINVDGSADLADVFAFTITNTD